MTSRRLLLIPAALCCLQCGAGKGVSDYPSDLPAGITLSQGRYVSGTDGMELCYVPGGHFVMGSADGNADERPEHRVRLAAFFIDVHEVTNAQFQTFVTQSGYTPAGPWRRGFAPGAAGHPVRFVTWHDAQAYATWAGRRLPTEAEWERAARGQRGLVYPWGSTWKVDVARADVAPSLGPAPVGSHGAGASPVGAQDMAGNVWEWVADWYDRYAYRATANQAVVKNPSGPQDGAPPEPRFVAAGTAAGNERSTRKVIRGGGWVRGGKEHCRCSKRMWSNPRYWHSDTGFRCAVDSGKKRGSRR